MAKFSFFLYGKKYIAPKIATVRALKNGDLNENLFVDRSIGEVVEWIQNNPLDVTGRYGKKLNEQQQQSEPLVKFPPSDWQLVLE